MSRKQPDVVWDPDRPTIAWKKTFDGVNFFTTTPDHAGPNVTYSDPEKDTEIKETIEELGEDRAGRMHMSKGDFSEIKDMIKEDVQEGSAEPSSQRLLKK